MLNSFYYKCWQNRHCKPASEWFSYFGQCCEAERGSAQTSSMFNLVFVNPPDKKSYQQTGQLSCDISWEKYISGNMGRNQCSASFLPLAELLVSAECVNKMFRLHLAGLTWHRLRSERETLTRSAARQRNSVLWHTGGFCTSLECLSDTKIFSLEQTVMHSELGRLLRYVFMYRQYIYVLYVYTHKVWRRALSSAASM